MKDKNNIEVKNGDKIKTERGSVLTIVEKNGELYMKTESNDKISKLSNLKLDFVKI